MAKNKIISRIILNALRMHINTPPEGALLILLGEENGKSIR